MRLATLGDLHIDPKCPVNRKDEDYGKTQFDKFVWCFEKALDDNCRFFLLPGDIFNNPRVSLETVQTYIRYLRDKKETFFAGILDLVAVYGQHDLYFHAMSSIPKTPLNLMEAAGVLQIAGSEPISAYDHQHRVDIYGASWECDIPRPEKQDGVTNVLLIHTMMIGEDKVWYGQEEFSQGRAFLREHEYDLVCSGDNHQQFCQTTPSGKALINAGSLMRSRVDQINHEPALYVYDTTTREVTRHKIPIAPYLDVIDIEKSEQAKERDERIEAFVESLDGDYDKEGINFRDNMQSFIKNNNIPDPVVRIINECMETGYEQPR